MQCSAVQCTRGERVRREVLADPSENQPRKDGETEFGKLLQVFLHVDGNRVFSAKAFARYSLSVSVCSTQVRPFPPPALLPR